MGSFRPGRSIRWPSMNHARWHAAAVRQAEFTGIAWLRVIAIDRVPNSDPDRSRAPSAGIRRAC